MNTPVLTSHWHLHRRTQQLVEELSVPPPGSQPLSFPSEFSRNRIAQYWVILWKNRKVYWRSPGELHTASTNCCCKGTAPGHSQHCRFLPPS